MGKEGKFGHGKTDIKSVPLLVIASAAWVVLLAGLAIADSQGASGLGLPWFIWAFEGYVLFSCILHSLEIRAGFSLAHAATAALLAVVTVLTILMTETFNNCRQGEAPFLGVTGLLQRGLTCAFAGFLALSVCNIRLLIILGKHSGVSSHEKEELHSQRHGQGALTAPQGYDSAAAAAAGSNMTTMV